MLGDLPQDLVCATAIKIWERVYADMYDLGNASLHDLMILRQEDARFDRNSP